MSSAKPLFHASRAARYDDTIRRVIPGYDTLHALSALILRCHLGETARILVAGCGTGAEIATLGTAVPGWRLVACDPSDDMMAVARARTAAAGLTGRVSLHTAPLESLPETVREMDAATCLLVLHFLPDDGSKLALLRAIAARLKPGAPLILADMYEDPNSPRRARMLDIWARWQQDGGIDPIEVDKGRRHVQRDIHFVSESRLTDLLAEAGFGPPERFFGAFLFGGYLTFKTGEQGQ